MIVTLGKEEMHQSKQAFALEFKVLAAMRVSGVQSTGMVCKDQGLEEAFGHREAICTVAGSATVLPGIVGMMATAPISATCRCSSILARSVRRRRHGRWLGHVEHHIEPGTFWQTKVRGTIHPLQRATPCKRRITRYRNE